MPSSLFFPLDTLRPSDILVQYSEWVYFTLRKHFDKPYVKPLIISVGLMLTVGVFRFKEHVGRVFDGWGILGTILLVAMAATIPYGLCRGFGLSILGNGLCQFPWVRLNVLHDFVNLFFINQIQGKMARQIANGE